MTQIPLLPGECWWGGRTVEGPVMPFDSASNFSLQLLGESGGNQAQPLLLSDRGRYVWSEKPFRFEFSDGVLSITDALDEVQTGQAGGGLREAFGEASRRFFPADGHMPGAVMFERPQYNTWIELMYDQNQADILGYARQIVAQGYPPGVLMIDDTWQTDYGSWEFDARQFPNPRAMMAELHHLGFKVMLWVCPFVSPDSVVFRELERRGLLLRSLVAEEPDPNFDVPAPAATMRWWNGVSACLDLSHPEARRWLKDRLDDLQQRYGVDGFKFDAGDSHFYRGKIASHLPLLPNEHTEWFARIGLDYPLNEYRAAWKMAGRPLAQRLRDKHHSWDDLRALIPGLLAQGLLGYAFTCPDMIGGGEFRSFLPGAKIDEELVIRSAQVHALMPMMQFSAAPWRILSADGNAICREMATLHVEHAAVFIELARVAARTGTPIVRPLGWRWPESGLERVRDQFMLGDELMVAPVLEGGVRRRSVVFPPGRWQGEDGTTVLGPIQQEIAAPLNRLPRFTLAAV